jgi:hypothetical protein
MSNDVELRKEKQSPSDIGASTKTGPACQIHGNGWAKGVLRMSICCVAALLLVVAVSFFGFSLGALAGGALSLAAVLACPVGMFLMMRLMMKDKN